VFNFVEMIKFLALKLIRLYQKTLSFDHGPLSFIYSEGFCRFKPTCSQYCYETIAKYGFCKGSWLGFKRICRCTPWARGGFDPVK